MRRQTLVAAICVMAFGLTAVASAPLAGRLPAGSLAYLGWAGKTEAMDASAFGELIADPMVTQIIGDLRQAAEDNIPPGKPRAIFAEAWSMAAIAWKRPIALALIRIRDKHTDVIMPAAAALIDLGEEKARFAKHLEAMIGAAGEDLELTEKKFLGVTYRQMAAPDGPQIAFGYVGNVFFACIGGEEVEKQIIGIKPPRSLEADKKFAKSLNAVGGKDAQYLFYADVDGILRQTGLKADEDYAPWGGGAEGHRVLNALGLGRATTLAAATRFVDGGVYSKVKLFSPAPHAGLLKLLAGKPLVDADLAAVPADADYVYAMNLSAGEAFAEIKRMVREAAGDEDLRLEEEIGEVEEELGLSFQEDIFAALGDTWVLAGAESQGGFLTGTVLTVEVKDPQRLEAAVAKIEKFLKRQFGAAEGRADRARPRTLWSCSMHPQVAMAEPGRCPICNMDLVPREMPGPGPRRGRRREQLDIKVMKVAKAEIHYVTVATRGPQMPVAPAWAVHEGKLYLALWPQVIAAVIESGPSTAVAEIADVPRPFKRRKQGTGREQSLIRTAAFRSVRGKVSEKPSILMYVDYRRVVDRLYPLLLAGFTAGANAAQREVSLPRMHEWLPTLPRLRKYLGPYVAAVSADDEGIVYEEYSSVPLQGLAGAGTAPAFLAGSYLSMRSARRTARTAVSASNLHQIGIACMMYANEYNGMFPPDMSQLVRKGYIDASVLVRPGARKAPRLVDDKLVGEVDYVYLGKGMSLMAAEPSMVLAHEEPAGRGDRIGVLFIDGHVERMSMHRFREAVKRTEEHLNKKSSE